MNKRISIALLACILPAVAQASGIDRVSALSQTQFKDLSLDLAAASGYKSVSGAASMGIVGFDVGMAVTATRVEHTSAWTAAMSNSGDVPSVLYVPKLYVRKGLPLGIDVGAYYFTLPKTNIEAWGGELNYEVMKGGPVSPAVGVGVSYTRLFVDKDLDLTTKSIQATISKGFVFITPYAGLGRQWANSKPGSAITTLGEASFADNRYFFGLSLNPGVIHLALEHDSVGGVTSNSIKLGVKF